MFIDIYIYIYVFICAMYIHAKQTKENNNKSTEPWIKQEQLEDAACIPRRCAAAVRSG